MRLTRKEFLRLAGLTTIGLASGCGSGGPVVEPPPPPQKNPLEAYKNLKNLYGDLHVHTNLSDGDESPDFALRYARDVSRLDFCSLSDHAEIMTNDGQTCMPYYRSLPAKYDDPGNFCVLYGYEWTSNLFGHRNIYSLDSQIPLFSSKDPSYMHIEDMWAGLTGHDVLTIPHHVMIPTNHRWWDYVNPQLERIVEFYSKWGYGLYLGNPRPIWKEKADYGLFDAFRNGRRYGIIASTDTHLSRAASRLQEARPDALKYPQPGIAGVWAAAHTREAIYDALKNRRCYGCGGTRVEIQFAVNNSVMGTQISSGTNPEIAFKVESAESIAQVAILKTTNLDPVAIQTYTPNDLESEGKFTDIAFTEDCSYMLRVDLVNSDVAMSSPVWVDKSHSGSIV